MAEEISESTSIKKLPQNVVMINTKYIKNYFNWLSKTEQFK